MSKKRADILLFEKGLVDSREKGKIAIMEGLVFIDNIRVDKSGEKIDEEAEIYIKGNPIKYVSRGGLKLEKALSLFPIDLNNKIAMDIGASTGGFTDCMLQKGSSKVYAVDVGYGQLDWSLRSDDRVIVMERTNIRNVVEEDLGEELDFISIDVSFISLKLVLPVAKKLLKEEGQLIALIKPQFEAGKEKVGKKGIIKDREVHFEVIKNIVEYSIELGFSIEGLSYSPVTGAKGNIEFLIYLKNTGNCKIDDDIIKMTIDKAHLELNK